MKPHIFKVLDQWLAFYRGDSAPAGFTAADTAHEAYRMLVDGNYSVTYEAPVIESRPMADVYYLHANEPARRPKRNRHRAVKTLCRSSGSHVRYEIALRTSTGTSFDG